MVELRNLKKQEVFLTLKRDLALVSSHSRALNPQLFYLFIFYFYKFLLRLKKKKKKKKKKKPSTPLSFPLSYMGSLGISHCQGVGGPCLV